MSSMRIPATVGVVVLLNVVCLPWSTAVQRDSLYPFGEFRNDQRLSIGDDISTSEIQLKTPMVFYENTYNSVYINLNGHLSFETEIPGYKSDLILPFGLKIIAPFLADVDTRLSGNVYYRETQDPSLLETATREIQRNFPRAITFSASSLFIVTWDMVGYFKERYDQTNTFQVVVASDGFDTYVFFHYVDDGINWVQSDGKNMPVHPDPPAQAGFDSGDSLRYYTLPGSGHEQVKNVAVWSNINVPGAWLFRVGNLGGANIELPQTTIEIEEVEPEAPSLVTCASGGARSCSSDAACQDYATGFCCHCEAGFVGNGVNCVKIGTPQRINGHVSGTVNGVGIEPLVLHTYVLTTDGRAYTAISRMPPLIGHAMRTVYTIGGVMGWLFALPSSPTSQNGFSITGGDFNRTVELQFVAGGEVLNIHEQFEGQGVHGYMKVTTQLNGNIPTLDERAHVTVDDYSEEYKRTRPGVIESFTTHTYRLDGVPYRFTARQTITYKECAAAPPTAESQKLTVNRNFITFASKDQIVRYAQSNRILAIAGGGPGRDPCEGNPCGPNSRCSQQEDSYTCACRNGYQGDAEGKNCADMDECRLGTHDCDYNAECVNFEGSFDCRCNQGYRGNGRQCVRDLSCADLTCDVNARCVFDSDIGEPRCECGSGFSGNGTHCERVEFSCNEVNNCGENAECLYDPTERKYKCECVDGFSGNGYTCTDSEQELSCRNCDPNAQCVYDVNRFIFRCECKEGFTGDGNRCDELGRVEDCSVLRNCDPHARCVYDDNIRQHRCICERGYRGDGYRCEEDQDCRITNACDANAQCIFNHDYRRFECRCDHGYEGDGFTCRATVVSCNQINNCDVNADCLYDEQQQGYGCRCRQGFEGDGFVCTAVAPIADCLRDPGLCDINARCVRQGYDHVCLCNPGYYGDGQRCAPERGSDEAYLMYAQGISIMQMPVEPTATEPGKRTITVEGQTAVGLDVDCYSRYFYWTDITGKSVSRARLDGSDLEVLVRGLGSPEGVAVDWVAGNMYWTDSEHDVIEVSKVDGTNRKTLFSTDIHDPRAIVVDPISGLVFWTDWYRAAPRLEVAHMDGSGRRILVDDNIGLPNGLTIDFRARQVCWADAGTMHIECINYDGRGRRTVYALASYPFDLALAGDVFFWTDWDMKSLPSIDKYGGSPNEGLKLPVGGNGKLYGIATVPSQCPAGSNACVLNNGGCRFLCLPTPNGGRTCTCPDDIEEEECNRVNLLK